MRLLARVAPASALVLGLVILGPKSATAAALFSALMLALLALRLVTVRATTLRLALSQNAISLSAFLLFVLWSLLALLPLPDALSSLAHPKWSVFGLSARSTSIAPYRAAEGVIALSGPAAAYALGALAVEEREDRVRLARLIPYFALALMGAALLHSTVPYTSFNKLSLNMGSANSAAIVFGAILMLQAGLFMWRNRLPGPWYSAALQTPVSTAVFLVCTACLILTFSRFGIAASLAGLVILLAFTLGRNGATGLAAVLGAVALMGFFGFWFVSDRLSAFQADAGTRQIMHETHWSVFLERPWLGHGLNTFHELNAQAATPETWQTLRKIGAAHNIYIQALEESGVLGLALLALMLAPPLVRVCLRALSGSPDAALAAAAFAATAIVLMQGAVDFALQTPTVAGLLVFWLAAFARSTIDVRTNFSRGGD